MISWLHALSVSGIVPSKRAHIFTRQLRAKQISTTTLQATSNEFWKSLNQAVVQGNGFQAEEIVNGLLKSYETTSSPSSDNALHQKYPSSVDTRIFSLVLQAWKNSEASQAPQRAQRLLEQMIAMEEEGILRDPPSTQDYHAVLECWAYHSSGSVVTIQGAESLLQLTHRMIQEKAISEHTCSLILSILANSGHAGSAIQFLDTIQSQLPSITISVEMYNYLLLAHLNSSHPDAAEQAHELFTQMRRKENNLPQPDGSSYDLVLQCWSMSSHAQAATQAQRLLDQMKADKIRTTLTSYQSVITLWAQKGEAKRAELLLTRLVTDYGAQFDAQLKPTLEPFQTVLTAYAKSFHPDAAPNAEYLLTHMRELYQSEMLETQPDVLSYNLVLRCWMHSKKPDAPQRAVSLLDQMRADGISPDTTTINSVLNSLANRGDALTTEELLWEFYERYLEDPLHNPQPDVISFGTALKAWSRTKDNSQAGERAEALLLKLQKLHESGWERCQPDMAVYSCVMKCHIQSLDKNAPHKVEALLRNIQATASSSRREGGGGIMSPDTICWNMALDAWAKAGNGPRAEALFEEMLQDYLDGKERAAVPNTITFTAVLSAWAKTQRNPQAPERAESLLQLMKQLYENGTLPDAKPNVISYSIVLDCLAYAKTSDAARRAESILREMEASDDLDVRPNVVSYNSVIKAWSFSRDPTAVSKVTALLKEMLEKVDNGSKSLVPNANTFGSVLKALADSTFSDKEKRAEVVVNLMEKFNIPWNSWSRNQLKRCSNGGSGGSRGRRHGNKRSSIPPVSDLDYS